MINYYDANYNIIQLGDYVKNIKQYSFDQLIEIDDKEYLNVIQKDYLKDFYSAMVDRDIETRWNDDLFDQWESHNSPFDYFVMDIDDLVSHDDDMVKVLSDLVYWLDMKEDEKFKFLYKLLRDGGHDYIIKVRRTARNIGHYPINDIELLEGNGWYTTYEYTPYLI